MEIEAKEDLKEDLENKENSPAKDAFMIEEYKNLSGDSGVTHFDIRPEEILLKYRGDGWYRYDYNKTGKEHVENMKALARKGRELSTYVSQNVKKNCTYLGKHPDE